MTQGASKFTLEIETENLAAWMAINNTFAWKKEVKEKEQKLWNGVLIQLGQYVRWVDDEVMHGFEKIQLFRANEPVAEILRDKFENNFSNPTWINVVARSRDTSTPMERTHLKKLLHTRPTGVEPCSLDRFFKPFPGCITLWAENGYDLKVESNEKHTPHKRYTLTIDQPYKVEITGAGAIQGLPQIDRLVICEPGVASRQQGGHQSPPQQP